MEYNSSYLLQPGSFSNGSQEIRAARYIQSPSCQALLQVGFQSNKDEGGYHDDGFSVNVLSIKKGKHDTLSYSESYCRPAHYARKQSFWLSAHESN